MEIYVKKIHIFYFFWFTIKIWSLYIDFCPYCRLAAANTSTDCVTNYVSQNT